MNTRYAVLTISSVFIFSLFIINFAFSQNVPPMPGSSNYSIPIKTGWNMISVPVSEVEAGSSFKSPALSDIKGCAIGPIWEFSPTQNSYIQPTILAPMKGYWVYSESDCNATITGRRSDAILNLSSGWNIISSRYSWNQIRKAGNPQCNISSLIYHFDPSKGDYVTVGADATLDDNKGYWVYADSNCGLKEAISPTCPIIVFPTVAPPTGCKYEYQYDNNGCVTGRIVVCPPPTNTSPYPPVGLGNVVTDKNLISPSISSYENSLIENAAKNHLQYFNNVIYFPAFDLSRGEVKLYSFDLSSKKWNWPYKTFTFEQKPSLFRTLRENDNLYFVMIGGTSGGVLKYNISQDKFENWKMAIGTVIPPGAFAAIYQDDLYLIGHKKQPTDKLAGSYEPNYYYNTTPVYVQKFNKSKGEFEDQYSGPISDSFLSNANILLKENSVLNGEIYFLTETNSIDKIIINTYSISQKRFYREFEADRNYNLHVYNLLKSAQYILKGSGKLFICADSVYYQNKYTGQCLDSNGAMSTTYISAIGSKNSDTYSIDKLSNNYILRKNNSQITQYEKYLDSTLASFYSKYCSVIGGNMWCPVKTSDNKLNFVIIGIE